MKSLLHFSLTLLFFGLFLGTNLAQSTIAVDETSSKFLRQTFSMEEFQEVVVDTDKDNVVFEQGDAFNADSIREITPSPNIVIVSGLYELFPENHQILTSLEGIAHILEKDGFLIYTNQPWHPQVELIARTLPILPQNCEKRPMDCSKTSRRSLEQCRPEPTRTTWTFPDESSLVWHRNMPTRPVIC